MTAYTPPTINPGDPFNGTTVATGFDNLSTVLNGNFDLANLPGTEIVAYDKFQRSLVTETFVSDSTGRGTCMFNVIVDNGTDLKWGPRQNSYDVNHTGVDFYLREAATCRFSGVVDLSQCKDYWAKSGPAAAPQTINYSFAVKLVVNGDVDTYVMSGEAMGNANGSGFQRYGFRLTTSDTISLGIGKHRAFLRLDCLPIFVSWASPNPLPMLSQWKCPYRSLSVHAIYQ